jgi:hypothetical protein
MWRYSVYSLDKLNELKEAKKRAYEEKAKRNAYEASVPDPFDFLANKDYLDLGRLASLAAFAVGLADLGSRGKTLQVLQNSW